MAKLSDKQASKFKRVMLYGPSFSGKSLLAGRLAQEFDLIWIDMEAGHGVLYQLPESYQERIEVVDLPDSSTYPVAIETVLKLVKGKVDICEQHGKVSCMICKRAEAPTVVVDINNIKKGTILIFDTISQLTVSALANITKDEADTYKLKTDDWGALKFLMDKVFSHIQAAQCDIVCITHDVEVQPDGAKLDIRPVGGSKTFSKNITKYFTDVVYLERKNKKHVCFSSTTSNNTVIAGSQTGASLEWLDEPSLLPLFMPEKYPMPEPKAVVGIGKVGAKAAASTGKSAAGSILARLAAKKAAQKT
jgi:hypothetical protein